MGSHRGDPRGTPNKTRGGELFASVGLPLSTSPQASAWRERPDVSEEQPLKTRGSTQVGLELHREGELRPALHCTENADAWTVEVTPSGPDRELVPEPEPEARSPDPQPRAFPLPHEFIRRPAIPLLGFLWQNLTGGGPGHTRWGALDICPPDLSSKVKLGSDGQWWLELSHSLYCNQPWHLLQWPFTCDPKGGGREGLRKCPQQVARRP